MAHSRHAKPISQGMAVYLEMTFNLRDLLGRRRGIHHPGTEMEVLSVDAPSMYLYNSGRLGNHHLNPSGTDRSEVSELGVKWFAGIQVRSLLDIGDKRLARSGYEQDFFGVIEVIHRRIASVARSTPCPDQNLELSKVRMEIHRGHRSLRHVHLSLLSRLPSK